MAAACWVLKPEVRSVMSCEYEYVNRSSLGLLFCVHVSVSVSSLCHLTYPLSPYLSVFVYSSYSVSLSCFFSFLFFSFFLLYCVRCPFTSSFIYFSSLSSLLCTSFSSFPFFLPPSLSFLQFMYLINPLRLFFLYHI